jgi:hypothetical protein
MTLYVSCVDRRSRETSFELRVPIRWPVASISLPLRAVRKPPVGW